MFVNRHQGLPRSKLIFDPCNEGCASERCFDEGCANSSFKRCFDEGCANNFFKRCFEIASPIPSIAKF
jgi:hypothetical protein